MIFLVTVTVKECDCMKRLPATKRHQIPITRTYQLQGVA